jgi:hypothetical protein
VIKGVEGLVATAVTELRRQEAVCDSTLTVTLPRWTAASTFGRWSRQC